MKEFRSQFRLPMPLAEKLKISAEKNHRSLNAEIVDRLESSFAEAGRASFGTVTIRSDKGEITVEASEEDLAKFVRNHQR